MNWGISLKTIQIKDLSTVEGNTLLSSRESRPDLLLYGLSLNRLGDLEVSSSTAKKSFFFLYWDEE